MLTKCDTAQQDRWLMEVKLADTVHVTAVWMKSEKTGVYASKILIFLVFDICDIKRTLFFISGKGCLLIFF